MQRLQWCLRVIALTAGLISSFADAAEQASRPFVPGFSNPDARPATPRSDALRPIRFITSDDYPPFGFALANGAAAGFEVDLARALCTELQTPCTIQVRPWGAILPAIEGGEGDAAIASLAITDEADSKVAFTAPYYRTPARFVTKRATGLTAVDPASLAGRRIGVVAGTAHQAYLGLFFPKAVAVPYPTLDALRVALKTDGIDAAFGDAVAWSIWLNGIDAAGCCAFTGGPYTESRFFGRGAGIAVRKDDVALRQALDYALTRVAEKGIFGDIYLRYFPIGLY